MDKNKVFNYINKTFDLQQGSSGWYRFHLPFDLSGNDRAAGINFNKNRVNCFRTGYKNSITGFLGDYLNCSFKEVRRRIEKQIIKKYLPEDEFKVDLTLELPKEFKQLEFNNGLLAKRAKEFLIKKGIKDFENYGYCDKGKYFGRIIIPIIIMGKLEYFIARTFIGQSPKYLNVKGKSSKEIFYNEDALYTEKKVYLVEGFSDAHTMGKSGVATLGWSLGKIQLIKLIHSYSKEIIIIADFGFYQEALGIGIELVEHKKVKVINIDSICTKKKKDVNDLGKEKVMPLIKAAKFETFETIINKQL